MNLNLFDEKKTAEIILAFSYFFDEIISKTLIPGQIEQWVTIMNIKGFSLFSLPLGVILFTNLGRKKIVKPFINTL